MKKNFLMMFALIILIMGIFISCSTTTEGNQESEELSLFLTSIANLDRLNYNGTQTITLDGKTEKQYSNVNYAQKPFLSYKKLGIPNNNSFTIVENKLLDNGKTSDYYLKTVIISPFQENMLAVDQTGNFTIDIPENAETIENSSVLEDEEKDLMIKYYAQDPILDIVAIANKNIKSFKQSKEKINDVNYTKYEGFFTVESILERYSECGSQAMEARLDMLNIESKLEENPSVGELKNHLMNLHEGVDIAEGIYELVYAEKPIPVSFWIPITDEGNPKIQIDYSNAYAIKQNKLYNLNLENDNVEKYLSYIILD